jgi:hypothetical protein
MRRFASAVFVVFAVATSAIWASAAIAAEEVAGPGPGAGQVNAPKGLATNFETGELFVADTGNDRISVFNADGSFKLAFGWGVLDGSPEFQACTVICRAGVSGGGAGQFDAPTGIAVDNDPASTSFGAIYVTDRENRRVQEFSPAGVFILMFGGGVDKTSGGDVCTAASGDQCGVGSNGSGQGEFSAQGGTEIAVGVGPSGTVYVADSYYTNGKDEGQGFQKRVQIFGSGGTFIEEHELGMGKLSDLAVVSDGSYFIATESPVEVTKFSAAGTLLYSIASQEPQALTIDESDHLLVADSELVSGVQKIIAEWDIDGEPVRRFGYGEITSSTDAVARNTQGVYLNQGSSIIKLAFPDPGPLILPDVCNASPLGNLSATLVAQVNPEGEATTTHFEYVDQESFAAEGGFSSPNTVTTLESTSIGDDYSLHQASAVVNVVPETNYVCRVIASNADGESTGPEGIFQSLPSAEIVATWASRVKTETASLNAGVRPLGISATGYFEYVNDEEFQAGGFTGAVVVPIGKDIDFGDDPTAVEPRSVDLIGLTPGTRYHYRVIVINSFKPDGLTGPERTFVTFRTEAEAPDGRAYEMVSPTEKNNADLGVPGPAGGLFDASFNRIAAASTDGEAVTFTSFTSFGENAESAPGASQYLSRRTGSGWVTDNINLAGISTPLKPPFVSFTPDLGFGAAILDEPPVTEEALSGFQNLYLKNNATGAVQTMTTEVPLLSEQDFCVVYAGSADDGARVFFAAKGAIAGAPKGKGFSLYEWHEGEGVSLLSIMPTGLPAQPAIGTTFGAINLVSSEPCAVGQKFVHNAISQEGNRVFWTYQDKNASGSTKLMVRLDGTVTEQVDAAKPGAPGPSGNGQFWTATNDGEEVLFTSPNPLTPTSGSGDLYRYAVASRALEDLTGGSGDGRVAGVVGASEDLSGVYFVARAVLSDDENQFEQKAIDNRDNLYLYKNGEGIRFVATLGPNDVGAWSVNPEVHTSRVAPDGTHMLFVSNQARSFGYDSQVSVGDHCQPGPEDTLAGEPLCPEVFLYGAGASALVDSLVCASCNPSGQRPIGPSRVRGWSNPPEGQHFLSDSGNQVFFETKDALSPSDQNGRFDVYEFEVLGSGTCFEESSEFVESARGCIYPISSGRSDEDSYILDASPTGRDVFFTTRERLLPGRDRDGRYDVYDYRVGGGFPELEEREPCQDAGECLPPASPRLIDSSPATSGFNGTGNVSRPKGKHKKRHQKPRHKRKHHSPKRHSKKHGGDR